jgi:perosamine synthetase
VPESSRQALLEEVNSYFTVNSNERAVVTFSVRSMLDLYLSVRKFPAGSEIIMTGINIPDMVQIMKEHKIKIVPVDLDFATMQPSVNDIRKAISPNTKACLFAFIFGVTYDIAPYAEILNSAGIEIIEDCAQSWRGLDKFRGSENSTMTMFSFGLIKYNTAFYGAVTIIKQNNETHKSQGDNPLYQ